MWLNICDHFTRSHKWLEKEVWATTLHRRVSVRATPAYGQSGEEAVVFPANTQEECRIVLYVIHSQVFQFNKP